MFYNADSPSFEDTSVMPENNNKGFDNINYGGSDFYDMDSEVSYTDLFSSGQDQAVPGDFLNLNTPVTSSEFNPLNTLSYMPPVTATAQSALPQMESPFYSSASSNYSVSPAPSLAAPAAADNMFGRGPVIVPSATAQPQKPRRKGGRKPKNDPLPPHLEERRRLRRIRNKEAAQKCRERRLAQTQDLLQQIDQLERQTRYFEETINRMREFKDQCEFVLNTHKNNCNMNRRRNVGVVSGLANVNYPPMQPCAVAHRRSSSSEGELSSPTTYIL